MCAQKPLIKDSTTYYLYSIYSGKKKNLTGKDKGHIVFNTKNNSAVCFTSCNFIHLKYAIKDQALKFTSIMHDKESCPEPLVHLENNFKENLPKVSDFIMAGKQLILLNKKDTLMVFYETNLK